MRSRRVILAAAMLVACTGGGAALTTSDGGVVEGGVADASADVVLEAGPPDAGGDCPAVCPPASTENFCDNFNRTNVLTLGWRMTADSTPWQAIPVIEASPCGHLLVANGDLASVSMLERTLAETVSLIVTFDLTMEIRASDAGTPDAGTPMVTLLAIGASADAIAQGAGVTVFYTPTQVGVSIGGVSSVADDAPPATPRHFTLTVTGRAGNFSATAQLAISNGPDVAPAVAERFTSVPFELLQLGLRSGSGFGHITAQIDNLGVTSE